MTTAVAQPRTPFAVSAAVRMLSGACALFFAWAAVMQLNDPDPARWFVMYVSAAAVASVYALGRALPRLRRVLGLTDLIWAVAILPELLKGWSVADLGATMSTARPEVEYGREFVGLLLIASYGFFIAREKRAT